MPSARSGTRTATSRWERICAVIRRVPPGRVASYGQVAALAGFPRHARQVGYALHALPEGSDIPWHRVINARGEISERSRSAGGAGLAEGYQRHLLEQEGVVFDGRGRVDLDRCRWEPEDRPRRAARRRRRGATKSTGR